MTEVEYGGGGHRTRLGTINLCVLGCPPAPVYKGARGRPAGLGARQGEGGVLLLVGVGLPLARLLLGRPHLPLPPLYTEAGGHPRTQELIYGSFISRVRCPLHHIPPLSYRRGV